MMHSAFSHFDNNSLAFSSHEDFRKKKETIQEFMQDILQIITPYKNRFESLLHEYNTQKEYGTVDDLQKASMYALSSGGKRFRPAITWMVAEALGSVPSENINKSAFAVEYFHTASLIADDLPCMDNDDMRRGVPTTHKAFPESTAILTSFSLIALGFAAIANTPSPRGSASNIHQQCILEASRTMGAMGLLGGQVIDLAPPDTDLATINQIIDMKTGALFDLSFTLGWLFGGGSIDSLCNIHAVALNFGRAFQILDDIDDMEKDAKSGKLINYAIRFGIKEAVHTIDVHVERAIDGMKKLGFYKHNQDKKLLFELTQILSFAAHTYLV